MSSTTTYRRCTTRWYMKTPAPEKMCDHSCSLENKLIRFYDPRACSPSYVPTPLITIILVRWIKHSIQLTDHFCADLKRLQFLNYKTDDP